VLPEPEPQVEPRRGLALLADVLIAPRRAYASIATTGEWWPAALAIALCTMLSEALIIPAELHVASLEGHKVIPLSATTIALFASRDAVWFLWQVFSWNIIASLYANFCAAGRPAFALMHRVFFALAANATLPVAVGAVAFGIAVRLHDPASFHTQSQLTNALPISLALFADPNNVNEVAFLANFDLTTVWSILLIAFGGRAIGGIRLSPALIVPCAVALIWAVVAVLPEVYAAR